MNITLYSTPSEYNRLSKALISPLSKVGNLTNDCNLKTPLLELAFDSSILAKNYCYIPDFARYYFIESMEISNKTIAVSLRCDVLMSFKNDILSSNGRITRSGNMGNKYIIDEMVTSGNHFTTQVRKLGNGFSKADNYIMTVGGSN